MNNEYLLIKFVVVVLFLFVMYYYLIAKTIHRKIFDEAYELGKKHGAEENELERMKSVKYSFCKKCETLYSYRGEKMIYCSVCGAKMEKEDDK